MMPKGVERIRYVKVEGVYYPVEIGHREESPYTLWCVQFGGQDSEECIAYCGERGWLTGGCCDVRN